MTRPSWVVVLLASAGCSFALTGPDSKLPRTQEPKCDTDKTAVLGDSLLATAAGITTLAVGADSGGAAVIPAVIGAVLIGAAIHGNNVVNDCRAAKEEYIASLHAPPPPPFADERDERAQFVRPPLTAPAATPPPAPDDDAAAPAAAAAVPAPAPVAAAYPTATGPVPLPARAAPPPAAPAATAPMWSAFWKEVR